MQVTFWKNVSGVYTADPRQVPEAFPVNSMRLGHKKPTVSVSENGSIPIFVEKKRENDDKRLDFRAPEFWTNRVMPSEPVGSSLKLQSDNF